MKFRRQVPLGPYIAEFYCVSAKLVVELDGISRLDTPGDATHLAWTHHNGWRVLRRPNVAVFWNLEGIVRAREQIAGAPAPPPPLPQREGELSSISSTTPTTIRLDV